MTYVQRKGLLLFLIFFGCTSTNNQLEYVCEPCDLSCDTILFDAPGSCPHCKMKLIPKVNLTYSIENKNILNTGQGAFILEAQKFNFKDNLTIYYNVPKNFNSNSRVLLVLPGAGRNGYSYLNSWLKISEEKNVLILALKYPSEGYSIMDYHLCGIMSNSNIRDHVEFEANTNFAHLDESKHKFTFQTQRDKWIFNDFDKVFDLVISHLGSNQKTYDIYGHSAGGQIIHRLSVFGEKSKADRIMAANSGFYTLPNTAQKFPFGIAGIETNLGLSYSKNLHIYLGELDNREETKGTLLRSTSADQQGFGRLERGEYFYNWSKENAEEKGLPFNWTLKVVEKVGHDNEKMVEYIGSQLY